MSKTVEEWLSMGNTVTVLPLGFSGEFNKAWSNSINRNHNNKIATLTEIQEVNNWCRLRKGRAKAVCLVIDGWVVMVLVILRLMIILNILRLICAE